jgi:diacylglycerol O-acyltransferase/trehalose O-mycolyltransferase
MRSRVPLLLLASGALVGPHAPAASAQAGQTCVPRTAPISTGIHERSRSVTGRLVTLALRSRAMRGDQKVNVLLPRRYDRSGKTRYPVLYLLHGAGGDNRSWLDDEHVQDALGSMPVIAVMPDGSATSASGQRVNGGYSDWFGVEAGSTGTAPAWESYHVRELVPFIDRAFPTRRSAAGRAIAGISMGGTGAMKYAGAFPGTFGYAGSFSGGLDAAVRRDSNCKWGEFPRDEVVSRDNNPTDLAGNLRGVRLFVRAGDGTPGPLDAPSEPQDPGEALLWRTRLATEAGAHAMAENFVAALRRAHIGGVDARFYHGSHSHPYWRRELPSFLAWLRRQLRRPPHAPRSFSVNSARDDFAAWGWAFRAHRRVREFVYLHVSGGRVTATGSGRLDVTTPARYRSRARYRVRIEGKLRTITADRSGRLAFTLDLGPSHTKQQAKFEPKDIRRWRTAAARIGGRG